MVVPFEPWHLGVMNIREEQRDCYQECCQFFQGSDKYGEFFIQTASQDEKGPSAWTALVDGRVYISAGIYLLAPYMGEAWSLISEEFSQAPKSVKIKIIKELRKGIQRSDLQRIQANTEEDFTEARRFLEFLGFRKEGIMENYTAKGENSVLYNFKGRRK